MTEFNLIDKNRDENIDIYEWTDMTKRVRERLPDTSDNDEFYKDIIGRFNYFDHNSDGRISAAEWRSTRGPPRSFTVTKRN
jgi:Ca2+-binding EF-hand superfamily protein